MVACFLGLLGQRRLNLLKNEGNINHVQYLYQFKCTHAKALRSSGVRAQCAAQCDFPLVSGYKFFAVATNVLFL